ncbi:Hypothetical predicted protein [Marmota monax]|uniref:MHC class I-like antigen recognition-like domain-containing protein n=1 Tax=Marmota monax TaxID=9995 RepID=A0A5E4A3T4_MARMO|nr:Hypothetical predicted protein [Marmota monax]
MLNASPFCRRQRKLCSFWGFGAPGPHILQMALGCDLKENGNFKSFWKYSFEGQDYLTFQPATLCWKADAPEAQSMAQSLKKDRDLAQHHGAFINGDC